LNANRKRGKHYDPELTSKGKQIGKNICNKKGKNNCKNKGIVSLFRPQKQADSIPKKEMSKPLPDWAKDTQVPMQKMRFHCQIQDALERVFLLLDVDRDGRCTVDTTCFNCLWRKLEDKKV
jgi:hypothetical protein